MIRADSVTKSFGKTRAVAGVSFEVKPGGIYGIVGPDGAGKSTLMKLCATTLETDSGSISIDGIPVSENLFEARGRIAYMPQKFGLYEDLTVEENVYFFGRIFGVSNADIRARLKTLYGFSRLEKFKDRPAGKLSGGMKQKLGLVCALVHTPEILVLDEPTNGVDPVSRREFWGILYELLSEGVSILVSTAYLDEAERCGEIAMMNRGKFMLTGNLDSIRESSGSEFAFIETDRAEHVYGILEKMKLPGIGRIGGTMRCFTGSCGISGLRAALRKKGAGEIRITRTDPSLEDCFRFLLAKEEARHGTER
jgi:ABC-2 type transport system ATP-binding protein